MWVAADPLFFREQRLRFNLASTSQKFRFRLAEFPMRLFGSSVLLPLLLVGLFAGQAAAGLMVNAEFVGTTFPANARKTVSYENSSAFSGSRNAIADQLNWKVTKDFGSNALPEDSFFQTFCIEIDRFLSNSSEFMIFEASEAPATLISQEKVNLLTGLVSNYLTLTDEVFDSSIETAAFQIATWELLNENGTSFNANDGTFKFTNHSEVRDLANTWLAGLNTSTDYNVPGYQLRFLNSDEGQDQFMFSPTSPTPLTSASVPEPAALAVWASFAVGLMGTAVRRRRHSRSASGPIVGGSISA